MNHRSKIGYTVFGAVIMLVGIDDYLRAIALRPDFAEAYLWRGYSYIITGNYAKAIADRIKAMKLKPNLAITRGH